MTHFDRLIRTLETEFGTEAVKSNGYEISISCGNGSFSRLRVKENGIYLADLYKDCGEKADISGKNTLEKIITSVREAGYKTLTLLDASEIIKGKDCVIPLVSLSIMLTGISWYNKFGFKSSSHEAEYQYNDKIRNLPFTEFLDRFPDRFYGSIENSHGIFSEHVKKMGFQNQTISDVFKKMFQGFTKEESCDNPEYKQFIFFLDLLYRLDPFHYNHQLSLDLQRKGGTKRERRSKKKAIIKEKKHRTKVIKKRR